MGLGINGGGLASARYFAERGAIVTVTDLSGAERLRPSLERLSGYPIRYVLGQHREEDFAEADLVIKNPGVRRDSPYLRLARRVATDIEVFLAQCANPIWAVTGSKGKSTTVSALYQILQAAYPGARLGGNITRSPLEFVGELDGVSPVVLELSSWQLGDLQPPERLAARGAAVTNLYHDHMNYYASMEDYARDKERIFAGVPAEGWCFVNLDNPWGPYFADRTRGSAMALSLRGRVSHPRAAGYAFYEGGHGVVEWKGRRIRVVPEARRLVGPAGDWALLFAASMALTAEVPLETIRREAADFSGIPHRMEVCHEWRGVRFVNDTAATIPEASALSYASLAGRVHWITGGTDKNLNLEPLRRLSKPPASLLLLEGGATRRMIPIFDEKGWDWLGPFRDFETALEVLRERLQSGDTVLMSPGAASFELFQNEFDRGERFRQASRRIYGD